jgi:hypothetical protein
MADQNNLLIGGMKFSERLVFSEGLADLQETYLSQD